MVTKNAKKPSLEDDVMHTRDVCELKNERVRIDRPVYTQKIFNQHYDINKQSSFNFILYFSLFFKNLFICDQQIAKKRLYNRLPCIKWIRNYRIKENLLADTIAGLTVGILYIPQGLAYALLAQVSPIYGLYTCFFPVLIYWIFGTSRHCSINTTSVAALLVGNTIVKMSTKYVPQAYDSNISVNLTESTHFLDPNPERAKILIAMTQAFWVGVIHILMFICQFSYLTAYLPEPFTKGFSVGCAFHVLTAQMKYLFGVKLAPQVGIFKIIKTYIDLFSKIGDSNFASVIISLICIPILAIIKYGINERLSHKIPFPIPAELVIVTIGTLASTFGYFKQNFQVNVIGPLETGLPIPEVPPLFIIKDMIIDCIILSIITYTTNFSLCDVYAKKHKYKINAGQELFAAGVSNIFGSFFNCFTGGASFATSSIQDSAGGKTQVVAWFSSGVLAVVLLKIGYIFEFLPQACLASIIVVSLKNLIFQLKILQFYWITNKIEFFQMLITFLSILILDVDIGLGIGVGYYVLSNLVRQTYPNSAVLGNISNTEIYKDIKLYKDAKEIDGIKIIRIEESLHYTNSRAFKKAIYDYSQCKPQEYLIKKEKLAKACKRDELSKLSFKERLREFFVKKSKTHNNLKQAQVNHLYTIENDKPECDDRACEVSETESQLNAAISITVSSDSENSKDISSDEEEEYPVLEVPPIHHIVLDCSPLNYIDTYGVRTLSQLISDYSLIGVQVYLAECNDAIRDRFKCMRKALPLESQPYVSENLIHPTIHDCVLHAKLASRKKL